MDNKEGNIDELVNFLIYNHSKIYLEILDKENEDYVMNNNDIFNFLTEILLKIFEIRYNVINLEELNLFTFNDAIIDFIKTKFLQLGIKISLIQDSNLPNLEITEDINTNKNLKDYKFYFQNNDNIFELSFDYFS
jgi:hypothetical protein